MEFLFPLTRIARPYVCVASATRIAVRKDVGKSLFNGVREYENCEPLIEAKVISHTEDHVAQPDFLGRRPLVGLINNQNMMRGLGNYGSHAVRYFRAKRFVVAGNGLRIYPGSCSASQ